MQTPPAPPAPPIPDIPPLPPMPELPPGAQAIDMGQPIPVVGMSSDQIREIRELLSDHLQNVTGRRNELAEELRFRTSPELIDSLITAGFAVEHVYGDWDRGPLSSASRTMVFIARRT